MRRSWTPRSANCRVAGRGRPLPRPRKRANFFLAEQRSAAIKLDWAKVTTSLGLRGQTVTSLHAFKKRNDDARRKLQALKEQPTTVDFSHYRSVLKNQAVVDEIEKRFASFKPATYDVNRQLKAIEAFEVEAVKNAETTKNQVNMELQDLEKTLKNIEEARPFEDLTVVCIPGASAVQALFARYVVWCRVWLTMNYRTRLPLPSPRSTRRPPSSSPRAAGSFPATRYAVPHLPYLASYAVLTPRTGEVRRPRACISNWVTLFPVCTVTTLAL